jgi:hypothetical protein
MTEQTADPRPSPPRADATGLFQHRSAIAALARDLQVSETEVQNAYESELEWFVDARIQMFVPVLVSCSRSSHTKSRQ